MPPKAARRAALPGKRSTQTPRNPGQGGPAPKVPVKAVVSEEQWELWKPAFKYVERQLIMGESTRTASREVLEQAINKEMKPNGCTGWNLRISSHTDSAQFVEYNYLRQKIGPSKFDVIFLSVKYSSTSNYKGQTRIITKANLAHTQKQGVRCKLCVRWIGGEDQVEPCCNDLKDEATKKGGSISCSERELLYQRMKFMITDLKAKLQRARGGDTGDDKELEELQKQLTEAKKDAKKQREKVDIMLGKLGRTQKENAALEVEVDEKNERIRKVERQEREYRHQTDGDLLEQAWRIKDLQAERDWLKRKRDPADDEEWVAPNRKHYGGKGPKAAKRPRSNSDASVSSDGVPWDLYPAAMKGLPEYRNKEGAQTEDEVEEDAEQGDEEMVESQEGSESESGSGEEEEEEVEAGDDDDDEEYEEEAKPRRRSSRKTVRKSSPPKKGVAVPKSGKKRVGAAKRRSTEQTKRPRKQGANRYIAGG